MLIHTCVYKEGYNFPEGINRKFNVIYWQMVEFTTMLLQIEEGMALTGISLSSLS